MLYAEIDLVKKGYIILAPRTEHAPFDLVAYYEGRFLRVQVKYRAAKNGVIQVPFSTCWADRNGTHTKPIDKDEVDVYCVYCPDTNRCYYIDPRDFDGAMSLRIAPARNGNWRRINAADDFLEMPERFRKVLA